MEKRFLSIILAICFTVCYLPCPAAAAETAFSDVKADDWFAPYVAACVEDGLMRGAGDGRFAPYETVTRAEVMAVAARVHDQAQGGSGALPEAPIEWGRLTVTRQDGLEITAYYDQDRENGQGWSFEGGGHSDSSYYLLLHVDPQLCDDWGAYVPVTLTLGDKSFSTHASAFVDNTLRIFSLTEDNFSYYNEASKHTYAPEPGVWYRDTVYDWKVHQLLGKTSSWPFVEPSTRWETASILLAALEDDLAPADVTVSLPGIDEDPRLEAVLPLYQAGIITGIDEFGHFHPDGVLTRAELAAIAARLTRPALRVSLGENNGNV